MSLRIAPGVRLRASSRGIRASVGPRAARLHVGAGRTTVSTGAGPVTVWAPLGDAQSPRPTLTQLHEQRRVAAAEGQRERLQALEERLTRLHLEDFPPAQRTVVPTPELSRADTRRVQRLARAQARRGVRWTDFTGRAARRRSADERAEQVLAAERAGNVVRTQLDQLLHDERWEALTAHDTATVIDVVDAAFADNASDSTCIDAGTHPESGEHYVTVVVLYGSLDMVPARKPAVTAGGRPTLRKRTKTERNAFYLEAMASTVLATVKETLAVSPATDEVNVIVLREVGGETRTEPIYLGTFTRVALDRTSWADVDPVAEILSATDARLRRTGLAKTVAPLRVAPGVEALAAAFGEARHDGQDVPQPEDADVQVTGGPQEP